MFLSPSQLVIEDRQRKEIPPSTLVELKRSILSKGLLHPIVVSKLTDGNWKLIAGERRTRAMKELHEEGLTFHHNTQEVPEGTFPAVSIADLPAVDLWEAELEENILRANLTWLEECEARAKIHDARKLVNPTQTVADTARYIETKKGNPEGPTLPRGSKEAAELNKQLLVARHKDDPVVKAAKTFNQAHKGVLDKLEADFKARLAKLDALHRSAHTLIKGDCRKVMASLSPGTFDVIMTDPPYGIDADTDGTYSKHFYDDTPKNALEVCYSIIAEGFRITKSKALLFMFCDIDHFVTLREYCKTQGWVPWRTPIIYDKGQLGHAPWGRAGFVRVSELVLFAVKGQRELYHPGGPDVKRVETHYKHKTHAAEKSPDILEVFLSRACLQGDTVIDPCCGSGSIFRVADRLKLNATGIELHDHYHNLAAATIGDIYAQNNNEDSEPEEAEAVSGEEGDQDY